MSESKPSRRIMAFNRITPEGFFATPEGALDWAVPDDEIDGRAASASAAGRGTLLFGRRTYQMFESFWPHALDDPHAAPDPHRPGRKSENLRAMGTFINEAEKVVFSRTLKEVTWNNTRLVREFTPAVILSLKQQPGRDILIFGSGSITSLLTEHGLIDEYQFVVNPTFLGRGRPLFEGVTRRRPLRLLEAKGFSSGNVVLRYGI